MEENRQLYPLGKISGTDRIGGWVGLGTGLDTMEKRNICCRYRKSNTFSSDFLVRILSTVLLSYSGCIQFPVGVWI
jgi:hypothetical protein